MRKNHLKRILSLALCFVLIAALALTGCTSDAPETTLPSAESPQAPTVLGEGSKVFPCTVVDPEGVETVYEIHTDCEMVGEALQALGILEGEEGPYGLFIKAVNGVALDYNTDGMYWSFYINGEYALTGVDQTPITEGESYMIKAEAA